MHGQLTRVIDELRRAQDDVHSLHAALPSAAWCHRPGVGCWSAAECLVHLNMTSAALLPLLRKGLSEAPRVDRGRRYRRNVAGWVMARAIAPDGVLRIPTVPAFVPVESGTVTDNISDFDRLQDELVACVEQGHGLALDEVFVVSPFHARLQYNVYAAMTLVAPHQQRHVQQAARAAATIDPVHAFAI